MYVFSSFHFLALYESKQRRETGRKHCAWQYLLVFIVLSFPLACMCNMNPSLRLYRRILKLHKNLPLTSKALGDQYLKDEFRRHKNATQEQITEFIQEWKVGRLQSVLHINLSVKFVSYKHDVCRYFGQNKTRK